MKYQQFRLPFGAAPGHHLFFQAVGLVSRRNARTFEQPGAVRIAREDNPENAYARQRTRASARRIAAGANNFALAYDAKSVTDTRGELGLRTDKSFAMADGVVTLRGRVAWAHDFNPDRSIARPSTHYPAPVSSLTERRWRPTPRS